MSNELCLKILDMFNSGISVSDIAAQYNFNNSKVYNLIAKGRRIERTRYTIRA